MYFNSMSKNSNMRESSQEDIYQIPLAMANIMPQSQITKVYNSYEALQHGTLFPELYKPFTGERGPN